MSGATEGGPWGRELLVTGDEISLKGRNRRRFEDILTRNVWNALGRTARIKPRRLFGRTSFPLPDDLPDALVLERVGRVPGVARFALARRCETDLDALRALALEQAREAGEGPFGLRASRSWKEYEYTSKQLERLVGGHIKEELGLAVDLTAPRFWVHVQVTERGSYVTTRQHRGLGGLPVRCSGRVVALLSGGLDSPVAAYRMMLRGCQVVLCHFLNQGQDAAAVRAKIEDLAEVLTRIQQKTVLYLVPFAELQRELIAWVPAPYRMLAYRRVMLRMAARIAAREGAAALVTGDSLGQVASQTMANLTSVWEASPLPVLAPLIGTSKNETVDMARALGSYEASIQPAPDCCQFMIAEHPATRSTPDELAGFEAQVEGLAELEARVAAEATPEITYFPPGTGDRYPVRSFRAPRGRRGR